MYTVSSFSFIFTRWLLNGILKDGKKKITLIALSVALHEYIWTEIWDKVGMREENKDYFKSLGNLCST